MTGKFNRRRSSLLLAGLSIAAFLTTSLLIANGQGYYNPHAYNDSQSALDRIDAARAYQNSYGEYYNPYSYNNDPQSALDLGDISRANQMLYNYDSSDWNYWANLWLNAPY
jgi:hypothetical protein